MGLTVPAGGSAERTANQAAGAILTTPFKDTPEHATPDASLSAAERIQRLREIHHRDGYLAYHAPRYLTLLELIEAYRRPGLKVLDIGRSHLTELLAASLGTRVDSLGFQPEGDTDTGRHYHFDLNQAQHPQQWRTNVPAYDVIVLAEVIEHLHTAPSLVLGFIRSLLRPGGILILQTPNAAALHKRVKLVLGRNPYEQIREDVSDPGHFREYTRRELTTLAQQAGFRLERVLAGSYFDYRYGRHGHDRLEKRPYLAIANAIARMLPPALKPGITLVLSWPGLPPGEVMG